MANLKKNKACEGETFDGEDRKDAKISIVNASIENFTTLSDFVHSLPKDEVMGSKGITTDATSLRVKEEKRNVHITTAYIYTFKRETDEDYHVILGNTPTHTSNTIFFDAEVSGLPNSTSADFKTIKKVRDDFTKHFNIGTHCHSSYEESTLNNPVKVEITGSIFFDELHFRGHASIGHDFAKATSYWEIHPITNIIFK